MKLTMKLTMRDPAFMHGIHDNGPRDHGVWRLTLALYLSPISIFEGVIIEDS